MNIYNDFKDLTDEDALSELLSKIENASPTQRDKGTTFENLCVQYFLNEPKYAELYSSVLSYSAWVEKYGNSIGITHKKDSGIDLIAVTKTMSFMLSSVRTIIKQK
jgi:predicted helicase